MRGVTVYVANPGFWTPASPQALAEVLTIMDTIFSRCNALLMSASVVGDCGRWAKALERHLITISSDKLADIVSECRAGIKACRKADKDFEEITAHRVCIRQELPATRILQEAGYRGVDLGQHKIVF